MKEAKELVQVLKGLMLDGSNVIPAVVVSVDKAACTCVVEFDELPIEDVRLRAAVSPGGDGVLLFPKVGSAVLVEKIGSKEDYFITMVSEVEEIKWLVDGCTLNINSTGFKIDKNGVSLADIIDNFFGQVKALNLELQKVFVAVGVTPNVTALQGINIQIDNNRSAAQNLLK